MAKQWALCERVPPCDRGVAGGRAVYGTYGFVVCDAPVADHPWHDGRLYWFVRPGPECPWHQCQRLHEAEAARVTPPLPNGSGFSTGSPSQAALEDMWRQQVVVVGVRATEALEALHGEVRHD